MNFESMKQVASEKLSKKRYIHSLNVADMAAKLSRKYDADEDEARAAGILHDITKELDFASQAKLIKEYGIELDSVEKENHKLIHAITGAAVAQDLFNISDDIALAIRYHTTGRAEMSLLEKIIYLADYIEIGRDFDGVLDLRYIAFSDIDKAMISALSLTVRELKKEDRQIHKNTAKALDFYKTL